MKNQKSKSRIKEPAQKQAFLRDPAPSHGEAGFSATPDDDKPYPHQHYWLLGLLALYFLTRLALLLLSRRYLMSDEAVVGVMACDILHGKPIPFFLYGQAYGGGHIVEALLMIPWLKLFGTSDLIVKAAPVIMGGVHLAVVYAVIYRFFSKRLALAGMAVYTFCCAFAASNLLVSGGMATWFFSWLGLYFFFCHYYGERPRLWHLALSGAALGFALYCYAYAIFYIVAVAGLLLYRHRLGLWRQWRPLLALGGGMLIGGLPLILYNIQNDFLNLRVLIPSSQGKQYQPLALFSHAGRLLTHDFPGTFYTEVNSFIPRIPWPSYLVALVFYAGLAYLVTVMRQPIVRRLRGLAGKEPPASTREERVLCLLYLFVLYGVLYCISRFAGETPRYVLNFYPILPVLFAWAILHLGRRRFWWAALALVLFLGPQAWYLGRMAQDKTTIEWNVRLHGEDIKQVVQFFREKGLRNVVGPYEVKWKLMFYGERQIACAAVPFGYDRENDDNMMVLKRINMLREPWALLLDKNLQLAEIAKHFNPSEAFDVQKFFAYLKSGGVKCDVMQIGDYVVFHNFTKYFPFFPPPPGAAGSH